jgi:hypothetical protein
MLATSAAPGGEQAQCPRHNASTLHQLFGIVAATAACAIRDG